MIHSLPLSPDSPQPAALTRFPTACRSPPIPLGSTAVPRSRDYYHTCSCLSGLAVAAAEPELDPATAGTRPETSPAHWKTALGFVNPVYNVSAPKVEAALEWSRELPLPPLPSSPLRPPPAPTLA